MYTYRRDQASDGATCGHAIPDRLLRARLVGIIESEAELVEFGLIELEQLVLGSLVLVDGLGTDELAQVVLIGALLSSRSPSVFPGSWTGVIFAVTHHAHAFLWPSGDGATIATARQPCRYSSTLGVGGERPGRRRASTTARLRTRHSPVGEVVGSGCQHPNECAVSPTTTRPAINTTLSARTTANRVARLTRRL
jgi:hypothetical protein